MALQRGVGRGIWRWNWADMLVLPCALITALLLGAGLIWASGASVVEAYYGLFEGMCGSRRALVETCVAAIPYMLAGLSVALGFHGGLFNIGAEGQFYMGALGAAVVGYAVAGIPLWIHLPLALLAASGIALIPRRTALRAATVVICLALGVLSWERSKAWESDEALWRATLEASPDSPLATFNLAHTLRQMLHLRPRNRFAELEGVYLTGGGTHPGSGLPVIYESARISSRLLLGDLGLDHAFIDRAREGEEPILLPQAPESQPQPVRRSA